MTIQTKLAERRTHVTKMSELGPLLLANKDQDTTINLYFVRILF